MIYRIGRTILAVVVVVASLPLSLLAMERGFGLAATLTVPTACLGFWFSLVAMFLQQFTRSFTSGDVTLLADPEIFEDHSILKAGQNSSGISEYRVIAPIEKHGQELWVVTTNRDGYRGVGSLRRT